MSLMAYLERLRCKKRKDENVVGMLFMICISVQIHDDSQVNILVPKLSKPNPMKQGANVAMGKYLLFLKQSTIC